MNGGPVPGEFCAVEASEGAAADDRRFHDAVSMAATGSGRKRDEPGEDKKGAPRHEDRGAR